MGQNGTAEDVSAQMGSHLEPCVKNTRTFQLSLHTPRYLCLPLCQLWPRKPFLPACSVPLSLECWSRVPGVHFDGAKLLSTSSHPCISCSHSLGQPCPSSAHLGFPNPSGTPSTPSFLSTDPSTTLAAASEGHSTQ